MNWGGRILCIALIVVGLVITPATASVLDESDDTITIYFWDCTGEKPVKNTVEFTTTEWNNLKNEIREIRTSDLSIEESFNEQFEILQQYNLIDYQVSYQDLEQKANEKFANKKSRRVINPLPDNFIFNAMCAINFELTNGTTLVFGLNTFINLVGFDIISFHKGYTPDGIETKGLASQSTDPGEYLGSMFGFLGYWYGTATGVGQYSDLITAGFTVVTSWLPSPIA